MISVSVVSHGHGDMVWTLVDQLLVCPEVSQVIVTLNIPEKTPNFSECKVNLIHNARPKGFGANHNAAFALATGKFFCVINPDIELVQNPFPTLIGTLIDRHVGLSAPLAVRSNGDVDQNMRDFLTPYSILKRVFRLNARSYPICKSNFDITPDWVAGMFMLFRSEVYKKVGGFDEKYFLYCEDADICTRLWKEGFKIIGCLSIKVVHNAQRNSHRRLKYLLWHLQSMGRYFLIHSFTLPNKD